MKGNLKQSETSRVSSVQSITLVEMHTLKYRSRLSQKDLKLLDRSN